MSQDMLIRPYNNPIFCCRVPSHSDTTHAAASHQPPTTAHSLSPQSTPPLHISSYTYLICNPSESKCGSLNANACSNARPANPATLDAGKAGRERRRLQRVVEQPLRDVEQGLRRDALDGAVLPLVGGVFPARGWPGPGLI